jgi:hypothetical protein
MDDQTRDLMIDALAVIREAFPDTNDSPAASPRNPGRVRSVKLMLELALGIVASEHWV